VKLTTRLYLVSHVFMAQCLIMLKDNFSSTASVVQWSAFLATDPEVPGSIPGNYEIFLRGNRPGGPLSFVEATWKKK
jgi:hypothetical protein